MSSAGKPATAASEITRRDVLLVSGNVVVIAIAYAAMGARIPPVSRTRSSGRKRNTAFGVPAAAFGPKTIWDFATLPTILGVLVNLAVGFGMIAAHKRYLQGLDELHQKIFLDAGALTLGVGLVCGLGYELLEDIKLISVKPEISHLVMLMCLTFLAGLIFGHRKYQ